MNNGPILSYDTCFHAKSVCIAYGCVKNREDF